MWDAVRGLRFCDDVRDKGKAIAAMEAHNAAVEAAIPPERLLKWRAGDGWEPICRALDVPVPDIPFPHTNTRREFLEGIIRN